MIFHSPFGISRSRELTKPTLLDPDHFPGSLLKEQRDSFGSLVWAELILSRYPILLDSLLVQTITSVRFLLTPVICGMKGLWLCFARDFEISEK